MTPHPHWTPVIAGHALAAALALLLGAVMLARRKGTASHRVLGWLWVLLMAAVAFSSFGITSGGYSWIHALSVATLVMLALGVRLARRRQGRHHGRTMLGLYVGALLVTGLFTLLPYRLVGRALVQSLPGS